jgi:hypothetical protein
MKTSQMVQRAFMNALGTGVYITLVSLFLSNGERWFGGKEDTFAMPLFMMLLLVISASVTGFLVLGKPVMMYHEGDKKEAVKLLFSTIGWLLIFAIVTILFII